MPSIVELGQKVKAKFPDAYGKMDDAAVGRLVKQKYPDAYTMFSDNAPDAVGGSMMMPSHAQGPSLLQRAGSSLLGTARDINKMMPQIGSSVGAGLGAVAGLPLAPETGGLSVPGGMAGGSMLGAGAGRSVEQALAGPLGQPEEVPGSLQQAYAQQALSAAGGGIPPGLEQFVSKYGPALANRLAQASLRNGFGDPAELANTMLKYGIKNTRAGLGRIKQLVSAFQEAHDKQMLEAAATRGKEFNSTYDVMNQALKPLYDDAEASAFPGAKLKVLNDLVKQFQELRGRAAGDWRTSDMDVADLNRMKELADHEIRNIYEANRANKTEVSPQQDLEQRALKSIADRVRTLLYGQPNDAGIREGGSVEWLADLDRQQSKLYSLKHNIGPDARKAVGSGPSLLQRTAASLPMGVAAATMMPGGGAQRMGAGLAGAAGGAALSSPQALSALALAAHNPNLPPILSALLRAGMQTADLTLPPEAMPQMLSTMLGPAGAMFSPPRTAP